MDLVAGAMVDPALSLPATFVATAQSPAPDTRQDGRDITVTGCLTTALDGRSYALTPLTLAPVAKAIGRSTAGVRQTFTYELTGKTDELRAHVNKVVTAKGRVVPSVERSTDVDRTRESTTRPSGGSDATPTVEVQEEVEIEVRRMRVASVTSEGKACPATR